MADDAAANQPSATPPSGGDAASKPPTAAESLAAQALAAAQAAVSQLNDPQPEPAAEAPASASHAAAAMGMGTVSGSPLSLPDFESDEPPAPLPQGMDLLADVNLQVKIELGRTRMLVDDILKLNAGAVVELDKLAGDPVDIYVNERPVARGEVLVLNDNFCVRINEILTPAAAERITNRGRADGPARST